MANKQAKYLFKCLACKTVMVIETSLDEKYIHKAPPCPCGKSRMIDMASYEYAYNTMDV
jgi:hypothetical protein